MIYFKRFSALKVFFIVYFGAFNLFWIQETYKRYNIIEPTIFGITFNGLIGLGLLICALSLMVGIKNNNGRKSSNSNKNKN